MKNSCRARIWIQHLVLLFLSSFPFLLHLPQDFLFDDHEYLLKHTEFLSVDSWSKARAFEIKAGRPVADLVISMTGLLLGKSPVFQRIMSVLCHSLVVTLFF